MLDEIDTFWRRHPRLVCVGITSLLPVLCTLAVPISAVVVWGFGLGFQAGLNFANILVWMTAVQIGPAAVSFALGWYLLTTPVERVWNVFWCFWSVPVVFACGIAAMLLFVP